MVVVVGETGVEPLVGTDPIPWSITHEVAPVLDQERALDSPGLMVDGRAVKVVTTAAGVGYG